MSLACGLFHMSGRLRSFLRLHQPQRLSFHHGTKGTDGNVQQLSGLAVELSDITALP